MSTSSSRSVSARGPKPRLSREQIVATALEMLQEPDAGSMRMRDLSGRLGVGVMTLYGYFESRELLEEAAVEAVMPAPPAEDERPWHELLRDLVLDIRNVYLRYPGVAEIMAGRSMDSPAITRLRERALELISRSGLEPMETVWAAGAVGSYITGIAQARGRARPDPERDAARVRMHTSSESLVLRRYATLYPEHMSAEATAFGLDLMIRGLLGLAAERATPSTSRT